MKKLTYDDWSEYPTLTDSVERRDWIHKHNQLMKRREEWRRSADLRRSFDEFVHVHVPKRVTPPAEEARGLALDVITEERCDSCGRLLRLIA